MIETIEQLKTKASALSSADRADLAHFLLSSLEPEETGHEDEWKTEIARRLARLAEAPFIKVEASKFTEVGYVGRDVESIIRDLTELAVNMVKAKHLEEVQQKAEHLGEDRLLDLLLPPSGPRATAGFTDSSNESVETSPVAESQEATRSKLRLQLRQGKLDQRSVEIEVKERNLPVGVISNV